MNRREIYANMVNQMMDKFVAEAGQSMPTSTANNIKMFQTKVRQRVSKVKESTELQERDM